MNAYEIVHSLAPAGLGMVFLLLFVIGLIIVVSIQPKTNEPLATFPAGPQTEISREINEIHITLRRMKKDTLEYKALVEKLDVLYQRLIRQ